MSAWLATQGHGFYLTIAYAVCVVAMLAEPLLVRARHRRAREAARQLPDDES